MCYFWDDLATAEVHRTTFNWQRAKQKVEITAGNQLTRE